MNKHTREHTVYRNLNNCRALLTKHASTVIFCKHIFLCPVSDCGPSCSGDSCHAPSSEICDWNHWTISWRPAEEIQLGRVGPCNWRAFTSRTASVYCGLTGEAFPENNNFQKNLQGLLHVRMISYSAILRFCPKYLLMWKDLSSKYPFFNSNSQI